MILGRQGCDVRGKEASRELFQPMFTYPFRRLFVDFSMVYIILNNHMF